MPGRSPGSVVGVQGDLHVRRPISTHIHPPASPPSPICFRWAHILLDCEAGTSHAEPTRPTQQCVEEGYGVEAMAQHRLPCEDRSACAPSALQRQSWALERQPAASRCSPVHQGCQQEAWVCDKQQQPLIGDEASQPQASHDEQAGRGAALTHCAPCITPCSPGTCTGSPHPQQCLSAGPGTHPL